MFPNIKTPSKHSPGSTLRKPSVMGGTENGDDEEDLEWVLNELVERVFGDTSNDQFGDHSYSCAR